MHRETCTTERVGAIVWLLASGASLTTSDIARRIGVGHAGAWMMLDKLSRVLPLAQIDGQWRIVQEPTSITSDGSH